MSNQREYENAMENPFERKRFIQGIDLGETGQYIRKLKLGRKIFSKERLMISRLRLLEEKPTIIIYPLAFSFLYHPRYDDFYSTLVYHEGFHAKQRIARIRLNPLEEFMAYVNQVKNFNSGNSDNFKKRIYRDIETIMRDFKDFGPQRLIDETNRVYDSLRE